MLVKTEPKYCRDCRKIRMCQRPGGEELFLAFLALSGISTTVYLLNWLGFVVAAISVFVFSIAGFGYMKAVTSRKWTCNKCAGQDIELSRKKKPLRNDVDDDDDDDDDDDERPRKKGPPKVGQMPVIKCPSCSAEAYDGDPLPPKTRIRCPHCKESFETSGSASPPKPDTQGRTVRVEHAEKTEFHNSFMKSLGTGGGITLGVVIVLMLLGSVFVVIDHLRYQARMSEIARVEKEIEAAKTQADAKRLEIIRQFAESEKAEALAAEQVKKDSIAAEAERLRLEGIRIAKENEQAKIEADRLAAQAKLDEAAERARRKIQDEKDLAIAKEQDKINEAKAAIDRAEREKKAKEKEEADKIESERLKKLYVKVYAAKAKSEADAEKANKDPDPFERANGVTRARTTDLAKAYKEIGVTVAEANDLLKKGKANNWPTK